ncbi:PAS-domain containing protein [Candidatus Mesenet endosymbiont of Phosphuga atrata]|uniref:PAS-domain containing protein n=1 Tax=Candidatus Mesenet endosymbiont of Phosphuga atrata TaxID=3066221 RepID=UPI0030D31210
MLTYIFIFVNLWLSFLVSYFLIKINHKSRNLEHENTLLNNLIDATDDGFYLWDAEKRIERFSPNLLLLFNTIFYSFNEFANFFEESDLLKRNLNEVKEINKSFTIKLKAKGVEIYCVCHGRSIIGSTTNIVGALLWIKNISDSVTKINNLNMENTRYTQKLRDFTDVLDIIPYPVWKRDHGFKISVYNTSYPQCIKSLKKILNSNMSRGNVSSKYCTGTKHVIINNERKLYNFTEVKVEKSNKFIGYAEDITQIEQLNNKLNKYITIQKTLLANLPVAIVIYDANQRLQFYNRAFAEFFSFDSLLLSAKPTYEEIFGLLKIKETLESNDHNSKQKFEFLNTLSDPYNYLLYLADGRILSVLIIPYAIEGLIFLYEDITNKSKTETSQ